MQSIEAVQFEDLFDKRLRMYDADKEMVKEENKEQQEAIKRLQEANAAFVSARRGDRSTKQREQALQSLENSFFKYKEIISNFFYRLSFLTPEWEEKKVAKMITRNHVQRKIQLNRGTSKR